MGIITKMRKQTCVYWPPATAAGRDGHTVPGTPVEKACRWDDVSQTVVSLAGEEFTTRAIVYVPDVERGGHLWLGTLATLPDKDPANVEDAYPVRQISKTPNFKATETLWAAYL